MQTMRNLHRLSPCRLCDKRMAVPGTVLCTMCDAVDLAAMVPDTGEEASNARESKPPTAEQGT